MILECLKTKVPRHCKPFMASTDEIRFRSPNSFEEACEVACRRIDEALSNSKKIFINAQMSIALVTGTNPGISGSRISASHMSNRLLLGRGCRTWKF